MEFLGNCLTCHKVKTEHQRPIKLLQPLDITELKGEHVSLDFVCVLPNEGKQYDAIWVIVDRLTKSVHIFAVRIMYFINKVPEIYAQ